MTYKPTHSIERKIWKNPNQHVMQKRKFRHQVDCIVDGEVCDRNLDQLGGNEAMIARHGKTEEQIKIFRESVLREVEVTGNNKCDICLYINDLK